MGGGDYQVRDERLIAAPIEACFAPLADLDTYRHWWTLVEVTALAGGSRLAPGVRFRFSGARPGGPPVSWVADVLAVSAPRAIELAYVEGDLLGRTAWELDRAPGGTRVAYVYRGVRANAPATQASFARYGTRLHSLAMQHDALAGLERFLLAAGASLPDEAEWRSAVAARVAAAARTCG
jgi:uncharacterized protein YndB with AHSA1/START domain